MNADVFPAVDYLQATAGNTPAFAGYLEWDKEKKKSESPTGIDLPCEQSSLSIFQRSKRLCAYSQGRIEPMASQIPVAWSNHTELRETLGELPGHLIEQFDNRTQSNTNRSIAELNRT